MNKKIFCAFAAAAVGVMCFSACTPKAESAWVSNIKGGNFSISYAFVSNTFDGVDRSVTVKDSEAFAEYFTALDSYSGTMLTADSDDEAYIFTDGELKYYLVGIGENKYKLSACWYKLSADGNSVFFAFPPVAEYYVSIGDEQKCEIYVARDWEYFCDFYGGYGCSPDAENNTVTLDLYSALSEECGKVTLQYDNYVISYSVEIDGEE